MRANLFLTGIYFFAATMCSAQTNYADSAKNSVQLIRIEQQLMDAIPSADTMTWKKYLDENFLIVTEDGTMFTKAPFIATFHPLPKGYSGFIKVIHPKLVFKENTAVISYVADEYETIFGQKLHTTYGVMNSYIKNDTSWSMIASQVFEIPQLPAAIKVMPDVLKNYTGVYELSDGIFYTVSLENGRLFGQRTGRQKEELLPETENVFFRNADTRGRKIFIKNKNGNMQMLERRNGNDVVWAHNLKPGGNQ